MDPSTDCSKVNLKENYGMIFKKKNVKVAALTEQPALSPALWLLLSDPALRKGGFFQDGEQSGLVLVFIL